jgi:hypothetical protein
MTPSRQTLVAGLSLTGGIVGAWFVIPALGSAHKVNPFTGVSAQIQNWWLAELVGGRVDLPRQDSQGYVMPNNERRIIITLYHHAFVRLVFFARAVGGCLSSGSGSADRVSG